MKSWGTVVAVLYVLILAVLSGPIMGAIFFTMRMGSPDFSNFISEMGEVYAAYGTHDGWIFLAVALIAQSALLSVPVEISAKRPVNKRTMIPLVLATSFTTALLIAGTILAVQEVFKIDALTCRNWVALAVFLFVWIVWAWVFFRWSRKSEPKSFVERQCQWMLRGSILELLIAVPSHIYVRQRTECCAGLQTGMGIAFGIAVMLFSFGPGVFFLYADRWKQKFRIKE